MDMVQRFKGLADPVRLRIFHMLAAKGELCVCHLTEALALPQSTVSRHLSILKHSDLITAERKGKWVYYCVKQGSHYAEQFAQLIQQSASRDKQLQKDLGQIKDTTC